MRFTKFIPPVLIAALIAINLLSSSGCANIVPPGGGPRDSIPPRLVSSTPKDSGLNITTPKILLNFDEFIDLKNATEKVLITPYPVKTPLIESKLRTVSVRLKDSLLPNTTYVIDFGDAITDLNEGNPAKNFRYVFSTGSTIDTNQISGNIQMAETGTTDSTLFALLYTRQGDSTVVKEKPNYVARVDANGNFKFTNLPAGTFYVYALGDGDGNKQYSQLFEPFAFLDSPVISGAGNQPVQLFAYAAEKEKKRTGSRTSLPTTEGIKTLIFSTNLQNNTQDLLDSFKLTYQKPIRFIDSSKIVLTEDSIKTITGLTIRNDSSNKQLIIYTPWKPGTEYKLLLAKEYARDSTGLTSIKNDTLLFRAKQEKEYGSVRIRFKNLNIAANPVLLIYKNNELAASYKLTSSEWFQRLYNAGDYGLGILYDKNQNGLWDPGDYFSKPRRQPEQVQKLKTQLTVKPNWDNEIVIELAQ
jgi:hypothetical protein